MQSLPELAKEIATRAHEGQFRRDGQTPYITHPAKVVERVGDNEQLIAVAWLHDVLEDTTTSSDMLLEQGIPREVVRAVELLTKTPGIPYAEYLQGIAAHPLAAPAKIADMLANLSDNPTRQQIRKYAAGLLVLVPEA